MLDELLRNQTVSRRDFLKWTAAAGALAMIPSELLAEKIRIRDNLSPWNARRPKRSSTKAIILHTTEGNDQSSTNAVYAQGTTNYIVHTDGEILRIIDRDRIAKHAGRSMWNGKTDLSSWSLGIEVVGYHDREPNTKQIHAIKSLLQETQGMYHIPDAMVMPHSMVAYDTPNPWHHNNHRGRKRCGMLFGTHEIRSALGLSKSQTYDPDVRAGRLVVADTELNNTLYGANKEPSQTKVATHGTRTQPDAQAHKAVPGPTTKRPDLSIEAITQNDDDAEKVQVLGTDGPTVWSIAGNEYRSSSTIYFMPNGRVRTGKELSARELDNLPKGTGILMGHVYGGQVQQGRSAYKIAGSNWNNPSTFYRLPNKTLVSGDYVSQDSIPLGTIVLFRR